MARIDQLLIESLTQLSEEEGINLILAVRERRRRVELVRKAPTVPKKVVVDLANMTDEQLDQLMNALEARRQN